MSGNMEFTAGSELYFRVYGEDDEAEDGIFLDWVADPKKFAKNLRDVASWVERYSDREIWVYVD